MTVPAASLRALVDGLVDYAGLFPPASLAMPDAVARYAAYLDAPESWMLGRFVVPLARLDELASAFAPVPRPAGREPWRLAVIGTSDPVDDARVVMEFNRAHHGALCIDAIETRAATVAGVDHATAAIGGVALLYVELPIADDPAPLIGALRGTKARAKVRTGGVVASAIPPAAQVARFIARCAELGVAWKATAGLHHPIRAEHRLTYEVDAASATMFGFLNVFCAGAFASAGMREEDIAALLDEREPGAITFGHDALAWRDHRLGVADIRRARDRFAIGFGSCSFEEPVHDLHQLALL